MRYLIIICVVISSLNLSHRPAGATHGPTEQLINYSNSAGGRIDNPFNGARSVTINMEREDFETPKRPVPYAEIWDNPLNQTAQQYVAILSMFEGKPLPEEIFRWVRMRQEERFIETVRQGILTGRYSPKMSEEKHDSEIWDTFGWTLLGLGLVFFVIGVLLNRSHVSRLDREIREQGAVDTRRSTWDNKTIEGELRGKKMDDPEAT